MMTAEWFAYLLGEVDDADAESIATPDDDTGDWFESYAGPPADVETMVEEMHAKGDAQTLIEWIVAVLDDHTIGATDAVQRVKIVVAAWEAGNE